MQTLEEKLKTIYDLINKYSLIKVYENDNEQPFVVDGIKLFGKNVHNAAFTRLFSYGFPLWYVTDAQVEKDGIVIHTKWSTYRLYPIQERQELSASSLPDEFPIDELMSFRYIDESCVSVCDNVVYMPVSIQKLGKISLKQETQIKRLLWRIFDGVGNWYSERCIAPAFSVEFVDNDYIVYAHIYDLVDKTYMRKAELYNSYEDFNKIEPFKELVRYAEFLLQ